MATITRTLPKRGTTPIHRSAEAAASRLNIPMSDNTHSALRKIAEERRVTMAELGRGILEGFLAEQARRKRREHLRDVALKHAKVLNRTAEEWRGTELDDWA